MHFTSLMGLHGVRAFRQNLERRLETLYCQPRLHRRWRYPRRSRMKVTGTVEFDKVERTAEGIEEILSYADACLYSKTFVEENGFPGAPAGFLDNVRRRALLVVTWGDQGASESPCKDFPLIYISSSFLSVRTGGVAPPTVFDPQVTDAMAQNCQHRKGPPDRRKTEQCSWCCPCLARRMRTKTTTCSNDVEHKENNARFADDGVVTYEDEHGIREKRKVASPIVGVEQAHEIHG
ncbi:hypothetical protein BJ742DRAFT_911608 [Cladochytrium replicatum]|nr:hypothetical protein BJ742DRAFT_911608 [Cladochytrium replicatum]